MSQHVQSLPFWKKIMYALGQFGWALTSYAVGNLLVYFYLPPETGEATFPAFFNQGAIVFGLTIIGLIFAVGRLFDAITDPIIAGLSDRSSFKFGRRRTFLAISIVPFAILSALAFVPPNKGVSTGNAIFVTVIVLLFYLFMTMYVTPYFAMLSEIGHTSNERLGLSTMISVTWALGTAVGSQVYRFQGMVEEAGYGAVSAFRVVVAGFAIVGFLFMLLPIIFIDERKYAIPHVSEEGIFEAVGTAFKNKNFLHFTLSDLAYWVSITTINAGLIYYVTVLLQLDKEVASTLQLMMFGLSFIFYGPTNFIAKKTGKKRLLIVAFVVFLLTFVVTLFLGKLPFEEMTQAYILVFLAAIPLAIFGILPNAMVADIAEADGVKTGNFKAGIYFGARTFMQKMGQSIAGILFPSLLLLGRSVENDHGIRMTAIVAIAFIVAGIVLLLRYNEKEIDDTIAAHDKK